MPFKELAARSLIGFLRHQKGLAFHVIIVTAVLEILSQPPPNLEAPIIAHCDIPKIKQPVDICSQQKAVGNLMLASLAERSDVGGVQNRQGFLARLRDKSFKTGRGEVSGESACAIANSLAVDQHTSAISVPAERQAKFAQ